MQIINCLIFLLLQHTFGKIVKKNDFIPQNKEALSYQKQLLKIAVTLVGGDVCLAEDLAKTIYCRLYEKENKESNLSEIHNMKAWLYHVLRNAISDYYVKEKNIIVASIDDETVFLKYDIFTPSSSIEESALQQNEEKL